MLEDAERFIREISCKDIGLVFLDRGKPVQPDLNALDKYKRHTGARRGIWPTSPEITSAMLERCIKPHP
jgi:hypothetical protein